MLRRRSWRRPTLDLGHAVFNEENPADLRIGDGETPGGIRVGSDWWTNNMLTAWGGLSRVDIEALLALSIGAYQERDTAALAALDAQVWRLDGRIDNLSADGLGAITAEADPIFAASAAYGITLGNLAAWNAAHGWGDHAQAGYLTEEADPAWAAAAPKYARLSDVEALVALSIPYVDLTPYALSADLLDYARLSDYAAATNAIWGSLASKAAASNLVAEAARLDGRIDGISAAGLGALTVESDPIASSNLAVQAGILSDLGTLTTGEVARLDGRIDGISAASLGALTEEVDPEWGAASPDVARLRDVEALLAFSLGYPQEQDSAALSAVAAVSGRVDTVEGWGDHSAAGYLTTEADAAALSAVAAVSGRVDTVEGWGDHSEAGYLTTEADAAALSAVAAVSGRVDTVEGWGDHSEAGYATTKAAGEIATNVVGAATNALLDLAGTRAMTGNVVTLARDIKSRDAVSVGGQVRRGVRGWHGTTAGDYGAAFGVDTTAGDSARRSGRTRRRASAGAAFPHDGGLTARRSGLADGGRVRLFRRDAHGTTGSFVFADSAPVAFDRTNSPNSFSVRAAGGTYFDTPLFTVTGEVAVESNLVVGNGQVFLNSSGTSWLQLDGTNIQFRATNGVTGRIQIIYE
jgi:hypothetical protein